MKILIVTPEYGSKASGIGYACEEISRHMRLLGHHVNISSTYNVGKKHGRVGLERLGIIGLLSFWSSFINSLKSLREDYDVLWLHDTMILDPSDLACFNGIVVNTFHTTYLGFYNAFRRHGLWGLVPYYSVGAKIEKHCLRELNHESLIATCVSPAVASELSANGLTHETKIVPNGLSLPLAQQGHLDPTKSTSKRKTLLYVGRMTEAKQPFLLLKLFLAIRKIEKDLVLILAGGGNLSRELGRKVSKEQGIHYIGKIPREHVVSLYNNASAYVSLSCYEGLPMSVLEAAGYGLPLILSDIPAHRWILQNGIGHGVLVSSTSPEKNAKEIAGLLENFVGPSLRLDDKFDWTNVVREYEHLFLRG